MFSFIDGETARDLMSHEGQKVYNYPLKIKIRAIEYAEINGNRAAERKFGVDEKGIQEWRANKEEMISTIGKVKSAQQRPVLGSGRKPFRERLEESVLG